MNRFEGTVDGKGGQEGQGSFGGTWAGWRQGGAGGATKKVKGRRGGCETVRLARNKRDGQRTCSFQLVSGLVRFNLFQLFRGQQQQFVPLSFRHVRCVKSCAKGC